MGKKNNGNKEATITPDRVTLSQTLLDLLKKGGKK